MISWAVAAVLLLGGCGGGGGAQSGSSCTLNSVAGCGGTLSAATATTAGDATAAGAPDAATQAAAQAASVRLVFSSTELKSAGASGDEITVTALVKDADNRALAGAKIAFSSDSGILTGAEAVTDKNGQAKALLGTGGSNANRTIHIVARVGDKSGSGTVEVAGTGIGIAGPGVISLGQSADLTVTLRDSAGRAISGAALTFSASNGNGLTLKADPAATSARTDLQGQAVFSLQAARLGGATVSVAALGANGSKSISVESNELTITPAVERGADGADLLRQVAVAPACQPVDVRFERLGVGQDGMVSLSTSRGRLYRDSACSELLSAALPLIGGNAPRSYVASVNTGVATLSAAVAGGPSASTRIEFVAPLTSTSSISLQADPAVISSNSGAGQTGRSELTAVVRDGSAANNLVKGAPIVYTIVSDPSGGYLLQPSSAVTGSDGAARTVYVAGSAGSGRDGVVIEARIDGGAVVRSSAQARLTVNKKALSIQFGTGNTVREYSPTLLQKEFAVLVSDSAGNAVPDVNITASAWPVRYGKGYFYWLADKPEFPDIGFWYQYMIDTCLNEDTVRNGTFDAAYDRNGNGVLDPGIPMTVSASGKTDALGLTTIVLNYPRDRGAWVQVELSVRGSVDGTEAGASTTFWLPTLSSDFEQRHVTPPGQTSPYGMEVCDSRY